MLYKRTEFEPVDIEHLLEEQRGFSVREIREALMAEIRVKIASFSDSLTCVGCLVSSPVVSLLLWWARHMRGARLESRAEHQRPAWPRWPHSLPQQLV